MGVLRDIAGLSARKAGGGDGGAATDVMGALSKLRRKRDSTANVDPNDITAGAYADTYDLSGRSRKRPSPKR